MKEICLCGAGLYRCSASTHDKKISVGFYCPSCHTLYDILKIPMVPAISIINQDPELEKYSDREEAYRAVLKIFSKYCRVPGLNKKTIRLDQEKISQDLKKDFEKVVS